VKIRRSRLVINRASDVERSVFTARPSMSDDLKFRHPISCIVSGPSGSGISSFCIRFIQNFDFFCTEGKFADGIVWCCGEKIAVPSRHKQLVNARFNEGVPEDF